MKAISGIGAAWLEHDGRGALRIAGKTVVFRGIDGFEVRWGMPSVDMARQQVALFRAATKHQKTRPQ